MNLILHLNAETEAMLKQRASSLGKQPEDLALEALHDQLFEEPTSSATLSFNEWLEEFNAWVKSHNSHNPRVDDSRESIYPDRW